MCSWGGATSLTVTYTCDGVSKLLQRWNECMWHWWYNSPPCWSLPDLTAGIVAPSTATANVAQTYTSIISNSVSVSTDINSFFYNFFQTADRPVDLSTGNPVSGATIIDQVPAIEMSPLASGGSAITTSYPITFTPSSTPSIRACADKMNRNSVNSTNGTRISESNEGNNCSPWRDVTVNPAPAPDLTASPPTPSIFTAGVAQTYRSTISNTGNTDTGSYFSYFWQKATAVDGGGTVTDLPYIESAINPIGTLFAGGTAQSISPSITFASGATPSIRVCADKTDRNSVDPTSGARIAESNNITPPSPPGGPVPPGTGEMNNCSPWRDVTVTGPNLTASAPTQNSAVIGTAKTFTSNITNGGTASTGTTFYNSLQVATGACEGLPTCSSAVSPLTASNQYPTASALAAGAALPVTALYTFTGAAGTRSVRFCADNNISWAGTISESNGDNCSLGRMWR